MFSFVTPSLLSSPAGKAAIAALALLLAPALAGAVPQESGGAAIESEVDPMDLPQDPGGPLDAAGFIDPGGPLAPGGFIDPGAPLDPGGFIDPDAPLDAGGTFSPGGALDPGAAFDLAAGGDLYLDLFINGAAQHQLLVFRPEGDGAFSVDADELEQAGLKADGALRTDAGRVLVDTLPGTHFLYDAPTQAMHVAAGDERRVARRVSLGASVSALEARDNALEVSPSGWGAFANYSLYGAAGSRTLGRDLAFEGASGTFDTAIFSPHGVLEQSFIASASSEAIYQSQRLDTTFTHSTPDRMRQLRLGDFINGELAWTRPVRMGGVQLRRDFGLRPDLVTLPIVGLSASAAVPSTVEVFLNGTRRYSSEIEPGPFELTDLPVVTGAGEARVVVREASGRETVTQSRFFVSDDLLAPGLVDYSAELGFVRRGFGRESFDYDERPMGSASLRYGLTPHITLEAHGEGGEPLLNGGVGVTAVVASRATVSVAASASQSERGTGAKVFAGMQTRIGPARLGVRGEASLETYDDIASIIDASERRFTPIPTNRPMNSAQVSLGVPFARDGSALSLSYTHAESFNGQRADLVSLSYSRPVFERGSFYATGFGDLATGDVGFHAGLSMALGVSYSASASLSGADPIGGRLSLAKKGGRAAGETSWRVEAGGTADTPFVGGRIAHRTAIADLGGEVRSTADHHRASAQMDGAIVLADADLFLSRPIADSFAVVDVGAGGIAVSHENQLVGRTRADGKLLVHGLRAYEKNHITIDPVDLPLDTAIDSTRELVVPAARSGVIARFNGSEASFAALAVFHDEAGAVLPLGSSGILNGADEPFVVGYDGQAYLDGLKPENEVVIERLDGSRCVARFSYAMQGGSQVEIPDITCRPTA